jgi:hypothetical protein
MSLFVLLLAGCLDAERFDTEWTETRCTLLSECEVLDLYGHSSEPECVQEADIKADGCETFDRKIGRDCLEGVEQMSCTALLDDDFPASCDQVCGD